MELLRLATAGAVDDGKSTLIGRLCFETKSIFEDQLAAVERTSRSRGDEYVNLALLTDGLRAEREQGITIDVAYRYLATPRRKFIIADTPGHVQYTRNMVTGASTANLALILVDARNGLSEQSRRHAFLSSLLRVPHMVLCVNKMDLVDYSQSVFERIRDEFRGFAARLEVPDLTCIPVSALTGENMVLRSEKMPWYQGPSLLHHLEEVYIASDRNLIDLRLPVQTVIRPMSNRYHDYRAFAGQLCAGVIQPGDEVMVLPAGFTSVVESVDVAGAPVPQAFPPMSVAVRLRDKLDVGRGDMICRARNQPTVGQDLDAQLCWMAREPLKPGARYLLKHTTRTTKAIVKELVYRFDVSTLHRQEGVASLELNDIGRVVIRTALPLFFDEYRRNRTSGSFILIDETSHATVGAGIISGIPR